MALIDEHTQVAVEVVSESAKLSGELLASILRIAKDMVSGKGKSHSNAKIYNNNNEKGKQKIGNLIDKHKGGIEALEENITKQQVKDYSKELKRLGVDFSVMKNGKDNYSFFFASKDSGMMEKALKNVIEKKTIIENKNNTKSNEKNISNNSSKNKAKNSENIKVEKENDTSKDESNLSNLNVKKNEIDTSSKKSILSSIENDFTKEEFSLFLQKNKKETQFSQGEGFVSESSKYSEMLKDFTPEQISKVNKTYETYIYNGTDKLPDNKVHGQEISVLLSEIHNEKKVTLDSVLNKLNDNQKELFSQLVNKRKESVSNISNDKNETKEHESYEKLKSNFSDKDISKVEKVFEDNIFSGNGKTPEYQLNINKVNIDKPTIAEKGINKHIPDKDKPKSKNDKDFYSMKNVKNIDKKIKNEEKQQKDKIKNKKQEQSR